MLLFPWFVSTFRRTTSQEFSLTTLDGRGSGEWRKLSVNIPAHIRAAIKLGAVHRFDVDNVSINHRCCWKLFRSANTRAEIMRLTIQQSPPTLHMSDLAELYVLLVEKILQGESVPNGESGYYFAMAHRAPWGKVMDGLAKSLYTRGLITDPKVKIWPSDDVASEELGFPRRYIRPMCTST